jgi:hypothetical protein
MANEEKLKAVLDEKQQSILLGMGKRKTVLFIRGFTKLYGKMCMDCRVKAHNDTNTPISEYCDKCRFKIQTLLDKYK